MSETVVVAIIALIGTALGAYSGSKLTAHRLDRLEKKVELHNNAVERLFIAEGNIREIQHEIRDLKKGP